MGGREWGPACSQPFRRQLPSIAAVKPSLDLASETHPVSPFLGVISTSVNTCHNLCHSCPLGTSFLVTCFLFQGYCLTALWSIVSGSVLGIQAVGCVCPVTAGPHPCGRLFFGVAFFGWALVLCRSGFGCYSFTHLSSEGEMLIIFTGLQV